MSFDWTNFTLALSPTLPYNTFYTNQPRVYMFQGTQTVDLIFLGVTCLLAFGWAVFCNCSDSESSAKSLIKITSIKILVNTVSRTIQAIILLLISYPSYTFLFIAATIETTLHYTFYLQFTSSVIFYVRDPNGQHNHFYLSLLFSLILSILNVNFNTLLYNIPFYIYESIYIPMILILILKIVRSCKKCNMLVFLTLSSPPLIFNAALTMMDLIYMVIGVSQVFPTSYILMSTYRYKAFEMAPICVLIAFLALIPDFNVTNSSSATIINTTHKLPPSSNVSHLTVPPSQPPQLYPPGQIMQQQQQQTAGTLTVYLTSHNTQ